MREVPSESATDPTANLDMKLPVPRRLSRGDQALVYGSGEGSIIEMIPLSRS